MEESRRGVRQGDVVGEVGWRWRTVKCNVCATTIIFLSADNTTLAISKNDRNSNILTKSRLEKYLLFSKQKCFYLQLDLEKQNTDFKIRFPFWFLQELEYAVVSSGLKLEFAKGTRSNLGCKLKRVKTIT